MLSRVMHTSAAIAFSLMVGGAPLTSHSAPQGSLAAGSPRLAAAEGTNTCLGCHARDLSASVRLHLAEWTRSAHGRTPGATCAQCHGGSATAVTATAAHGPHMPTYDADSPTNRRNLAQTCGRCHTEEWQAFKAGPHHALVQGGNLLAPRCITCHGELAADRVSPDAVQAKCAQCHAAGRSSPHPEYVAGVRLAIVQQQVVNSLAAEIRAFALSLPAGAVRNRIDADLRVADSARRTAIARGHDGGHGSATSMLAAHDLIFALSKRVMTMSGGKR